MVAVPRLMDDRTSCPIGQLVHTVSNHVARRNRGRDVLLKFYKEESNFMNGNPPFFAVSFSKAKFYLYFCMSRYWFDITQILINGARKGRLDFAESTVFPRTSVTSLTAISSAIFSVVPFKLRLIFFNQHFHCSSSLKVSSPPNILY